MITSPIMTSSDNCRYRHRGSAADFRYLRSREMQSSLLVQQISAVPCEDCPSGTGKQLWAFCCLHFSRRMWQKGHPHHRRCLQCCCADICSEDVPKLSGFHVPRARDATSFIFWYWIPVELVSMRFFLFFLLTLCYLELRHILIRLFSVQ